MFDSLGLRPAFNPQSAIEVDFGNDIEFGSLEHEATIAAFSVASGKNYSREQITTIAENGLQIAVAEYRC